MSRRNRLLSSPVRRRTPVVGIDLVESDDDVHELAQAAPVHVTPPAAAAPVMLHALPLLMPELEYAPTSPAYREDVEELFRLQALLVERLGVKQLCFELRKLRRLTE